MSKYLELSALACQQTNNTFEEQDECQKVAHIIALGYRSYLDVPEMNFFSVLLDNNTDIKEVLNNISRPKLVRGADGFWYFAFKIHFCLPQENSYVGQIIKIGLKTNNKGFVVRIDEDYSLSSDFENELEPIFSALYEYDIAYFSKPLSDPKPKIGFV